MTLLRKTPALRLLCLATPLLLLGACGGGGGGSSGGSDNPPPPDNGPLTATFSYLVTSNLGYAPLAPMSIAADISGLGNNTPHCVLQAGQLPTGVTLTPSTCTLEGSPEETGQFSATVRLTVDGYSGYVDAPVALTVNGFTFTYSFDVAGVPWGADFATTTPSWGEWWPGSGDSVSYRLDAATSALGLQIDPATGVISGHIESKTGEVNIKAYADVIHNGHTITAETSSNEVVTINFPNIFYPDPVSARVGQPLSTGPTPSSADFAGRGYTVTYTVPPYPEGGSLPPGLVLNTSSGVISGTPTTTGNGGSSIISWQASKGSQRFGSAAFVNFDISN